MAKRKGAGTSRAKSARKRPAKAVASRGRTSKKAAGRRRAARTAATKRSVGARKAKTKRPAARKAAPKGRGKTVKRSAATARRASPAVSKVSRKAKAAAKVTAAARKRTAATSASRRVATVAKARSAPPKVSSPRGRVAAVAAVRKAPSLDRERRIVPDDDVVQQPPSTLDLDRTASSARSGRRGLRDRFDEHTETGPALTGGDVDADWESAYSVGDEAPGGDSPTPDQDIVDDIGRAVGVEYQDNEELKGDEKIASRDRHRWELDPASAEDYDEH